MIVFKYSYDGNFQQNSLGDCNLRRNVLETGSSNNPFWVCNCQCSKNGRNGSRNDSFLLLYCHNQIKAQQLKLSPPCPWHGEGLSGLIIICIRVSLARVDAGFVSVSADIIPQWIPSASTSLWSAPTCPEGKCECSLDVILYRHVMRCHQSQTDKGWQINMKNKKPYWQNNMFLI